MRPMEGGWERREKRCEGRTFQAQGVG